MVSTTTTCKIQKLHKKSQKSHPPGASEDFLPRFPGFSGGGGKKLFGCISRSLKVLICITRALKTATRLQSETGNVTETKSDPTPGGVDFFSDAKLQGAETFRWFSPLKSR